MIDNNHISTASFNQIADKEYFDTVMKNVVSKIEKLNDEEKAEIEGFLGVYTYAIELIEQLKSIKNEKVINLPENIVRMEKPTPGDSLEAKIEEIKFSNNERLFESIENEKKYKELIEKYKICEPAVNMYLSTHPLLKNNYNCLNYIESEQQIVDYNYIMERCNVFIESEKNKYAEAKQKEKYQDEYEKAIISKFKKKNRFKNFIKVFIVLILIFGILIFLKYYLG
ncbi:MAG: hypothetical protein J5527_08110 [Treponema sp.]|nr:hypothetical protein [Treponema sp.]